VAGLIPVRSHFHYPELERVEDESGRRYQTPSGLLWSVTTILDYTKSEESRRKLADWEARTGHAEALRIKDDAAEVGTHLHLVVDTLLHDKPLPPAKTWLAALGYELGYRLVNQYFPHLSEAWGSEVRLYYPKKYAGTTDLVGVYRGNPAIIDLKQSLKPKRRGWIEDYFHQLAAYALAHDTLYGTNITHGYVLIGVQNGETQEFSTSGNEFARYKEDWKARVSRSLAPGGLTPASAVALPSP
jgi:genome maintenance exonuclease 1